MPRSFNAAAMARNDVAPPACISAMVGAMSAARALARLASVAHHAVNRRDRATLDHPDDRLALAIV
jgi:hypothetical protein